MTTEDRSAAASPPVAAAKTAEGNPVDAVAAVEAVDLAEEAACEVGSFLDNVFGGGDERFAFPAADDDEALMDVAPTPGELDE